MTIPLHLRDNTHQYARINGFHNIGFLTGVYLKSIPNQEPITNAIWLLPPGIKNLHHAMPVILDPKASVLLPGGTQPGDHIHVKVRLEQGVIKDEERSVIPRAIVVERPNIINSNTSDLVTKIASRTATEQDPSVMPLSEDRIETFNPVATQNRCTLAGFLSFKRIFETASGRSCLAMLIQTGPDESKAIHARMYASTDKSKAILRLYYKAFKLFTPYHFSGNYRVNVKLVGNDENDLPIIEKFGYFHVDVANPAKQGDIPVPFPSWVDEAKEMLAADQRFKAQPQLQTTKSDE